MRTYCWRALPRWRACTLRRHFVGQRCGLLPAVLIDFCIKISHTSEPLLCLGRSTTEGHVFLFAIANVLLVGPKSFRTLSSHLRSNLQHSTRHRKPSYST